MQNANLQQIIKANPKSDDDDDNLENVLEVIFNFYEHFLYEDSTYEDSISTGSTSSTSYQLESGDSFDKFSTTSDTIINTCQTPRTETEIETESKPSNSTSSSTKKTAPESSASSQAKRSRKQNRAAVESSNSELRLNYLMKVPQLISEAVNSSNMKLLKTIVDEAFSPDCKVRTNALPSDLVGRDHLVELHTAINRQFPDYLMNILPPSINDRVITAKLFTTGTCFKKDDPSDHLFNHLKHSTDETFQEAREKSVLLHNQGKLFTIKSKTLMHLVLNEEFTLIEMINYASKVINIVETPFTQSCGSTK